MTTTDTIGNLLRTAFDQADEAPVIGLDDLVIWGGEFSDGQLDAFLDAWGELLVNPMFWHMYEYVSNFLVKRVSSLEAARPTSGFDLERVRFFGPSGDLDLRRDGQRFLWRFIGERDSSWPDLSPSFEVRDFWAESPPDPPVFRQVAHRYYQWRAGDERVNQDWWRETGFSSGRDIYLTQDHYLHSGRIAFVRYTDLTDEEVNRG
jgi:hypothetical protein